jgi:hypothetical protein
MRWELLTSEKKQLLRRETQECFAFLLYFWKMGPILRATPTQINITSAYHKHHRNQSNQFHRVIKNVTVIG